MKKIILILIGCLFLGGCWQKSEGQKVGVIVMIAEHGLIWKTYEGELVRGGLQDANGANGAAFHFGFGSHKRKIVEKAIECMDKNKPVTILYKCELFVAPWRSMSDCLITDIQEHVK